MLGIHRARSFFTKHEKERIIAAIGQAEAETSGEVRVHVEPSLRGKVPFERAKEVFQALGMTRTAAGNGVLIYLAVDDRKFAIIGDQGIDRVVPEGFWEETKEEMGGHFRKGQFVEGICHGVLSVGDHLKRHFPHRTDDLNELPDEISEGEV